MADYHQMWQDLGMDVKTHDLLCEALPGAFGDVFLSQQNRPEGMDYFNMVVAEIHGIRPAELVEHKKNGGKLTLGDFNKILRSQGIAIDSEECDEIFHRCQREGIEIDDTEIEEPESSEENTADSKNPR